ncbi:MAG: hypothetical protein HRT82_17730 [Henriciella sp.]|nr:hypothetical protein [Henriciella sp.]
MELLSSLLVSLASNLLAIFWGLPRAQQSNPNKGKITRRVSSETNVLWGAYRSKKTVSETSEWDGRSDD